MGLWKIFLLTLVMAIASACAPMAYSPQFATSENIEGEIPFARAECEVFKPNYTVDMNVVSFEMKNKAGLSVGFNAGGALNFVGLEFALKQAEMALSMDAYDPVHTNEVLGSVRKVASKIELKAAFSLNFGAVRVEPGYYYQTPLANLSYKAMQNSLNALASQLQNESPWSARVLVVPNENEIIINAGNLSGVREGDEFALYNIEHVWAGEPCVSEHIFERQTTREPLAIVRATSQRTGHRALLDVISQTGVEPIQQGAKLLIKKLPLAKGEKRRNLKKQIQIGEINSRPLMIDGKTEIDVVDILKLQVQSVVFDSNFTLKESTKSGYLK